MKVTVMKRVEMDGKVVEMSASAEIPEQDPSNAVPDVGEWNATPVHQRLAVDLFQSMDFPLNPNVSRY